MTPLSVLVKRVGHSLQANSPAILTALGVSGTITTAYLAAQAGMDHQRKRFAMAPERTAREEAELVWKIYIPPAMSAAVTIGCIIGATKVSSRRTAAITAAYSIGEKAFTEYKEKVIEKMGENKEQAVRDEIAQDRIKENPPSTVFIASGSNVLCCELYTGRYFESDMETLRKAQNVINDKLNRDMYASLSDFYYIIGIPQTSYSSDIGWTTGKLMEMQFSTVMSEDDRPCLAFEYNYVKPID
jgi:hypothetical protein